MKRQLSNTIYGLNFAMEKNDFERLKSSRGKKRNDFVINPTEYQLRLNNAKYYNTKVRLDRLLNKYGNSFEDKFKIKLDLLSSF